MSISGDLGVMEVLAGAQGSSSDHEPSTEPQVVSTTMVATLGVLDGGTLQVEDPVEKTMKIFRQANTEFQRLSEAGAPIKEAIAQVIEALKNEIAELEDDD